MPQLDEADTSHALMKLLLIGDSKAGKTPWAGLAAMNYNVLYLDGDVGLQSLNKMDSRWKPNVKYIPCGDSFTEDGDYTTGFADFFTDFTTSGKFVWNDSKGKLFSRRDYEFGVSTDNVWEIKPARMDYRDIVILDSWSALVQSVMEWKARELKVDLSDIEKIGREIYSAVGNKLTQYLTMIRSWPCHVIVIAHPAEYVKTSKPIGKNNAKETELKIEWTKSVPKSSSNPHALTMAKYFSDVGWLDIKGNGETDIDFKPATDRIIGGHLGTRTDAFKTTVADVIQSIGGYVPEPGIKDPSHWLTVHKAGTFEPAGGKKPLALGSAKPSAADTSANESLVPDAQVTPVKMGLAGLMGKTKGVEPGMSK